MKSRKNNNRSKFNKKIMVAAAALTAAAVTGSALIYVEEPVRALAKESFKGVHQIVKDHEDDPFVILDVVPGTGLLGWSDPDGGEHSYEFSLGTIGYLNGSLTPIEEDLTRIFTSEEDRMLFYSYVNRYDLADSVVPAGYANDESDFRIAYEEAYGGVSEIKESDGWIKLFDSIDTDLIDTEISGNDVVMPDGLIQGKYQKVSEGEGAFELLDGEGQVSISNIDDEKPDVIYEADEKGSYRVAFAEAGEATEGYIATVVSSDLSSYSATTSVYRLVDGKYVYVGQVKDVTETEVDAEESETQVDPENPDQSEDDDEAEEPEKDSSDSSDDDEEDKEDSDNTDAEAGETGSDNTDAEAGETDPDNTGAEAGETDPDNTDAEEETVVPDTLDGGRSVENSDWQMYVAEDVNPEEYYILRFEYVTGLEEAQMTYKVGSVYELSQEPGTVRAYDTYSAVVYNSVNLFSLNDEEADDDMGEIAASFLYVGEGNGDYQLEESTEDDAAAIEVKNVPVYFRCCGNNDWIKKYVFNALKGGDNESGDFSVEIRVVRADELDYNAVYEADLVFMEAGTGEFLQETVQKSYIAADTESDLQEDAAYALINRAVEELMPVMVDYGIISDTENYKDSAYQKTAQIFCKKNLSSFFYEMEGSMDNMYMNLKQDIKEDNQFHYVNKNIYIINGMLVGSDFNEAFDDEEIEAGFKEIRVAIDAENTTISEEEDKLSQKISKAKVMQYIINYAVGMIGDFEVLNILELQPSANETADLRFEENGDIILVWQKKGSDVPGKQLLRSSSEITTKNIEVKSVAEFNGEWKDINSAYQMIFIGLDGQRLNQDELTGETRYNNTELNKLVYHTGDVTGGSGDQTYDANDITEQKKYDLLEFMRAGYPIVVEDDFFRNGSAQNADKDDINTDYIMDSTQMYDFIASAISDEEILEKKALYTISDLHSSSYFMAQLTVSRPNIAYQDEDTPAVINMTENADEKGQYIGEVAYCITDHNGEQYLGDTQLSFYLDMNGDGIYDETELLSEEQYSVDNGTLTLKIDAASECILPWKLEVSDAGNQYRRDNITGYFRCSGADRVSIQILQVVDENDLDNAAVNMQDMVEENSNILLGLYLQRAQSMLNVEYDICTLSLEQLETKLASEESGSRYVNNFDIIVLGVSDMDADGSVAETVNSYIADGGSVLITASDTENSNQKMGLNADLIGLEEGRTYGSLGRDSSSYYRYSGLQPDMFYMKNDLYVEPINQGIIFRYPYSIDNTIYFGSSTVLKIPDYLLDFDITDMGEARTTAWCTLNSVGEGSSAFQVSVRDARNNYYAYSKGSVFYVGQKSYPYTYDSEALTEDGAYECQFFVNALMAAYNAGIHNSDVSIVAGFNATAAPIESIVIPFDQVLSASDDSESGILDEMVDVYFKFSDNNLAIQKEQTVRFYYEDPAGVPLDLGDRTVNATEFSSGIDTVENNRLVEGVSPSQLNQQQVYRIKAPVVALKTDNSLMNADIYVVVETVFNKSGREYRVVSNASVSLNRAQLFLLE